MKKERAKQIVENFIRRTVTKILNEQSSGSTWNASLNFEKFDGYSKVMIPRKLHTIFDSSEKSKLSKLMKSINRYRDSDLEPDDDRLYAFDQILNGAIKRYIKSVTGQDISDQELGDDVNFYCDVYELSEEQAKKLQKIGFEIEQDSV